MEGTERPPRNVLIAFVVGLVILWFAGSWWWYTCHIKNSCVTPATQGSSATSTPATSTTTASLSDTRSCALIHSQILLGGNNNRDDVLALERFMNKYRKEALPENGVYEKRDADAVSRFQREHWREILAPYGLHYATRNVSTTTRNLINDTLCAGTKTP